MKQIILENRGLIRAIIRKLTGSYNDDIEQEVYIKTWKNDLQKCGNVIYYQRI